MESFAARPLCRTTFPSLVPRVLLVSRPPAPLLVPPRVSQGPPGTGKTHTAAHIIAELLLRHQLDGGDGDGGDGALPPRPSSAPAARVGVLANSHDAISLLMGKALARVAQRLPLRQGRNPVGARGDSDDPAAVAVRAIKVGGQKRHFEAVERELARATEGGAGGSAGGVAFEQSASMATTLNPKAKPGPASVASTSLLLGATAWGFSNSAAQPQQAAAEDGADSGGVSGDDRPLLDYLFVDEVRDDVSHKDSVVLTTRSNRRC